MLVCVRTSTRHDPTYSILSKRHKENETPHLEINLKKEQFPCKKNYMFYFDFVSEDAKDLIEKLLLGGRLPTPSPKCTVRISATET